LELFGHLIGQCSRNPSAGSRGSASGVLSELVDSSLSVFLGADYDDVIESGDRGNNSCGKFDSSVDFVNFEDVVSG